MSAPNAPASVRARLLNHARKTDQDFNLVLTRYCLERMLYRIGISDFADQLLLKGALLFDLWFDVPHRPTRDADFLGFGSPALTNLENTFGSICAIVADDGVEFHADTVRTREIRDQSNYAGMRITLLATLDGARCPIQLDIGFGDAVTPEPEKVSYPTLLPNLKPPQLLVYPTYSVVAEKFEALVTLGIANSRMKDYFDLWILAQRTDFEGNTLSQAILSTFTRRETRLPENQPYGLTRDFAEDQVKQTQWQAFQTRNRINAPSLSLIVDQLSDFLMPPVREAITQQSFNKNWRKGGPWNPNTSGGS